MDLLVDDRLIVELKSVDQLLKVHEAQIRTNMKPANMQTGAINFNVELL
jgi:GxxExxY protein